MWKISGYNSTPLFVDQKMIIAKINFRISELRGNKYGPLKIYYRLFTIDGNLPELDSVSSDFQGQGIPFDRYPRVGEILFRDWYYPDKST